MRHLSTGSIVAPVVTGRRPSSVRSPVPAGCSSVGFSGVVPFLDDPLFCSQPSSHPTTHVRPNARPKTTHKKGWKEGWSDLCQLQNELNDPLETRLSRGTSLQRMRPLLQTAQHVTTAVDEKRFYSDEKEKITAGNSQEPTKHSGFERHDSTLPTTTE